MYFSVFILVANSIPRLSRFYCIRGFRYTLHQFQIILSQLLLELILSRKDLSFRPCKMINLFTSSPVPTIFLNLNSYEHASLPPARVVIHSMFVLGNSALGIGESYFRQLKFKKLTF